MNRRTISISYGGGGPDVNTISDEPNAGGSGNISNDNSLSSALSARGINASVHHYYPDLTIREGNLAKESLLLKKWTQRRFALKGKYLFRFNDKNKNPEPDVDLSECSECVKDDSKPGVKYCFKIIALNGKTVWYCATSERDRIEWIVAIQHAIINSRIERDERRYVSYYSDGSNNISYSNSSNSRRSSVLSSSPLSSTASGSNNSDPASLYTESDIAENARMKKLCDAIAGLIGKNHPAMQAVGILLRMYEETDKVQLHLMRREVKLRDAFVFKRDCILGGKSYHVMNKKDLNQLYVTAAGSNNPTGDGNSNNRLNEEARYNLLHLLRERTSKEVAVCRHKKAYICHLLGKIRDQPNSVRRSDFDTYESKADADFQEYMRRMGIKTELESIHAKIEELKTELSRDWDDMIKFITLHYSNQIDELNNSLRKMLRIIQPDEEDEDSISCGGYHHSASRGADDDFFHIVSASFSEGHSFPSAIGSSSSLTQPHFLAQRSRSAGGSSSNGSSGGMSIRKKSALASDIISRQVSLSDDGRHPSDLLGGADHLSPGTGSLVVGSPGGSSGVGSADAEDGTKLWEDITSCKIQIIEKKISIASLKRELMIDQVRSRNMRDDPMCLYLTPNEFVVKFERSFERNQSVYGMLVILEHLEIEFEHLLEKSIVYLMHKLRAAHRRNEARAAELQKENARVEEELSLFLDVLAAISQNNGNNGGSGGDGGGTTDNEVYIELLEQIAAAAAASASTRGSLNQLYRHNNSDLHAFRFLQRMHVMALRYRLQIIQKEIALSKLKASMIDEKLSLVSRRKYDDKIVEVGPDLLLLLFFREFEDNYAIVGIKDFISGIRSELSHFETSLMLRKRTSSLYLTTYQQQQQQQQQQQITSPTRGHRSNSINRATQQQPPAPDDKREEVKRYLHALLENSSTTEHQYIEIFAQRCAEYVKWLSHQQRQQQGEEEQEAEKHRHSLRRQPSSSGNNSGSPLKANHRKKQSSSNPTKNSDIITDDHDHDDEGFDVLEMEHPLAPAKSDDIQKNIEDVKQLIEGEFNFLDGAIDFIHDLTNYILDNHVLDLAAEPIPPSSIDAEIVRIEDVELVVHPMEVVEIVEKHVFAQLHATCIRYIALSSIGGNNSNNGSVMIRSPLLSPSTSRSPPMLTFGSADRRFEDRCRIFCKYPPEHLLVKLQYVPMEVTDNRSDQKVRHSSIEAFNHFYARPIHMLRVELGQCTAPRDKLDKILDIAKEIFKAMHDAIVITTASSVNNNDGERASNKMSDEEDAISTDDFLPVLIYITIQARPAHICSQIEFIHRYATRSQNVGERSYYLTSLETAVEYVKHLTRDKLQDEDMPPRLALNNTDAYIAQEGEDRKGDNGTDISSSNQEHQQKQQPKRLQQRGNGDIEGNHKDKEETITTKANTTTVESKTATNDVNNNFESDTNNNNNNDCPDPSTNSGDQYQR